MTTPAIRQELAKHMDRLPPEKQLRVLQYAQELAQSRADGEPGKNLLPFAGLLDPEAIDQIRAAIEEDCERVDPNEW